MGPCLNFDNFLFILKKTVLFCLIKCMVTRFMLDTSVTTLSWSQVGAFNSNFSIFIAFLPQIGLVESLFPSLKVGVIT